MKNLISNWNLISALFRWVDKKVEAKAGLRTFATFLNLFLNALYAMPEGGRLARGRYKAGLGSLARDEVRDRSSVERGARHARSGRRAGRWRRASRLPVPRRGDLRLLIAR